MLVMWGATGIINWNNERAEAGTTLLTISRRLIDGTEFFAFGSETFVRITGILCEAEASIRAMRDASPYTKLSE